MEGIAIHTAGHHDLLALFNIGWFCTAEYYFTYRSLLVFHEKCKTVGIFHRIISHSPALIQEPHHMKLLFRLFGRRSKCFVSTEGTKHGNHDSNSRSNEY